MNPPRNLWIRWLLALPTLAGIGTGIVALAGFFPHWGFTSELASHFRFHYALALLAVTVTCLFLRQIRRAILFFVFAVANAWVLLPFFTPKAPLPSESVGTFSVLTMNVHGRDGDPGEIIAMTYAQPSDLVVLLEITPAWIRPLSPLRMHYPFHLEYPNPNFFGLAVYSRLPIENAEVKYYGEETSATIRVTLRCGEEAIELIAAHPYSPSDPERVASRNRQLLAMAEAIHPARRTVVAGDLNITPWHPALVEMLRLSGLKDSAIGSGYQPTWPAWQPLARIPIDYILHSPDLVVLKRSVGSPTARSDHLPVWAEFALLPLPPVTDGQAETASAARP